jgi:hypothetical protein
MCMEPCVYMDRTLCPHNQSCASTWTSGVCLDEVHINSENLLHGGFTCSGFFTDATVPRSHGRSRDQCPRPRPDT